MRRELGVAIPHYFRRVPLALPSEACDQEDSVSKIFWRVLAARFGEERQHPEFDIREQNFGWQVGQFPSETGTPSDDHGGGTLKAFGRLVPETLGSRTSGSGNNLRQRRPYQVRSATPAFSTGSVVSRNHSSRSAPGGGAFSRTCMIVTSTGALRFTGNSTLR